MRTPLKSSFNEVITFLRFIQAIVFYTYHERGTTEQQAWSTLFALWFQPVRLTSRIALNNNKNNKDIKETERNSFADRIGARW